MIALAGMAGGAAARSDRLQRAAEAAGDRMMTLTEPDAPVRLGIRFGVPSGAHLESDVLLDDGFRIGEGGVVATAVSPVRTAVAMGSGLARMERGGLAELLEFRGDSPSGFLGAAPYDLAVLVADRETGTLTLGTSPGTQRLFVTEVDDGFLVSTQLAVIADALGPDLSVDRSYEDFLLGFGFLPNGRTPYTGVHVLPAGSVRTWPDTPRSRVGANGPGAPDPPSTAREARRRIHDTFLEVLEEQVGARHRHAVLLGGFDSALVAAGLRRLGHDVHTYTFSFGDPQYEQRDAERIAQHLGADHHWVRFTPDIIGEGLGRFAEIFNQPAPQPHYQLHTAHACRVIAGDGHDHVFTGDGCDAVFLGYPTVSLRARLLERSALLPRLVRRPLLGLASSRIVERRLGHVARTVRSALRSVELPWPACGHLPTRYLDGVALERLRSGSAPLQAETVPEIRLRLAQGLGDLEAVRLAFHGNSLIGQSGAKVEGAVAASGVAQMSPYRHPRLRSVVRSLPLELLRPSRSRPGSVGKAVLYDMVRERDLLPEFVLALPKQSPSDSPIDRWYAGPLRPLVYRLLDDLPFEYNRHYVDEILARKWVEDLFRNKVSLGHHAFQAIGLLCSYAAFTGRAE